MYLYVSLDCHQVMVDLGYTADDMVETYNGKTYLVYKRLFNNETLQALQDLITENGGYLFIRHSSPVEMT